VRGSGATVTAIVALHRMKQAYTIERVDGASNDGYSNTTSGQRIVGASARALVSQYADITMVSDGGG
jgi:hypothetical protein